MFVFVRAHDSRYVTSLLRREITWRRGGGEFWLFERARARARRCVGRRLELARDLGTTPSGYPLPGSCTRMGASELRATRSDCPRESSCHDSIPQRAHQAPAASCGMGAFLCSSPFVRSERVRSSSPAVSSPASTVSRRLLPPARVRPRQRLHPRTHRPPALHRHRLRRSQQLRPGAEASGSSTSKCRSCVRA
jgi:hypothetical protein